MRLKEFLIAVFIFTIAYILFCYLLDKISDKRTDMKYQKKIKSMINLNNYIKFAKFYGIQSAINLETLLKIQSICTTITLPVKISELANKFMITPYELVVCILFFEYLNIISKRTFVYDLDLINNTNTFDLNLISKYNNYFINKKSINEISNEAGYNAINDIFHLNQLFLIPGVRLINNQLYYVGDLNEEN